MEIIDRPLSEIIKEQKIGESLRRNRRNGRQRRNPATGNNGKGPLRGRRFTRGDGRRRFRLRQGGDHLRRYRFPESSSYRRRYAVDYGDVRRDRSVKSVAPTRGARRAAFERNEYSRAQRRREVLARARDRDRFSRD
ncbi:hypothetical protein ERJ75_001418900 [Trypanosoma vivax]|uniref:Uncharacterized protein n=1 Tax=Trypanosoma vivax (strain Y486) TaxID=1055687 RepID=G0TUJ3_TRYVY|nr:hypothetical protein TRVL_03710 [Trypanosoma vivax]KAH8607404.1 hypothetical protein ERJ75_001418900 [Trypanosoma vivax]CCC47627.1 conserved hypothetical protein [Trypanosoma vivax Y486]